MIGANSRTGDDMDRRYFIGAGTGAAAGMFLGARSRAAAKRPNIVIIMADDMGWGDLGCYGCESIATPNLDRLAGEGVRLTSFYSAAAVCSPSRGGLLTGRYPARIGIRGVYFPSRFALTPLIHAIYGIGPGMNTDEFTTAELLKDAGYNTCCIGKWHLGDMKRHRPHHRGFDHYMGVLYSNDMTPLPLYRNDEVIEKSPVNQDFLTRKYTEEALSWIEQNHDRPFFLYFAHTFPHIPLHAHPEFRGRSRGGLYGDCVEEIDWSVGRILAALEKHGVEEDTFVFFTSDNGPWYEGSTGELRGRKGSFLDGGHRVPGIARYPGVIPAGAVSDQMAMNIDLFTTSLALAGVKPPADRPIDGKDIMPMLSGKAPTPHEALYFYGGITGRRLRSMRTQRWKYHRRHAFWTANYFPMQKGPMLYDLELDQGESFNVARLHPEVAKRMDAMMNDWEKNLVRGAPRRL